MSDSFIGEIRMFAGDYAPEGWAICDGSLQNINTNQALFALIGTTYGGDGQNTFALPDLRGRIPIHNGNGTTLAEQGGVERVTLQPNELPAHSHAFHSSAGSATESSPNGAMLAPSAAQVYRSANALTPMAPNATTKTGNGEPHDNVQPFLAINFIIALTGYYPQPE